MARSDRARLTGIERFERAALRRQRPAAPRRTSTRYLAVAAAIREVA